MDVPSWWMMLETVTWLRISTSNIFFSQYLLTVSSSLCPSSPTDRVYYQTWQAHDHVCWHEPEGPRSLHCSVVLLSGNGLWSLDFFNCCITKLAGTLRWLSFSAYRTGTLSEPCEQQDCVLLGAISRWWPLQQVHGPSSQTNTIVYPRW